VGRLHRDVSVVQNRLDHLGSLRPQHFAHLVADPTNRIPDVRVLGRVEQISKRLPGGGRDQSQAPSLSQPDETTRRYETVPYVLDPGEKRQLIKELAVEFGDDLPFDDAVQILIPTLAPELDSDLRAMYAGGRIYNRAGRLNIKLSDTRGLKLTIAAAIAANLMAHDATMETAAIVLAAAADRVRILKDDELEVFDVMLDLSYGRIYKVWVGEDQLIESLSSNGDTDDRRRLPARMKSKGILEEGAGRWRAVR
jgi:hypothetical protein